MEGLRCAAFIDLNRAAANYNLCKSKRDKLIAVVKADAYGHGAVALAEVFRAEGCSSFAVSNPQEGKELREGGIDGEIILLGYCSSSDEEIVKACDITPLIYDERSYRLIRRAGLPAYIKIDTGMRRLGFTPDDVILEEIIRDKGLKIVGAMTHLSVADSTLPADEEFTRGQIGDFTTVAGRLRESRPDIKLFANNSAGLLRYPHLFDGARAGIALYGINPSGAVCDEGLLPIMTVKATISSVKTVKRGDYISYGRKYRAERTMKIAVVTAGYADGIRRSLSGKGCVLIGGRRANILGVVTMDQTIVGADDVDARVGDEVVFFGDGLTATEVATAADTISYEIVCGISKRVPRIYTSGGKIL